MELRRISRRTIPKRLNSLVIVLSRALLGTFPRLGCPVHGKRNVRFLPECPVQIYYRLGPGGRSVEILRFWHSSRDPDSFTMD